MNNEHEPRVTLNKNPHLTMHPKGKATPNLKESILIISSQMVNYLRALLTYY